MLFELQPFEKPVVLNFFLQNLHGFFNVIVNYLDCNFLQKYRPFLFGFTFTSI